MILNENIIIAIDGHASCGKSTLAKKLAKELKYSYIDTGAMYRAVTLYAIKNGYTKNEELDKQALINDLNKIDILFSHDEKTGINSTFLNGKNVEEEIRTMKVAQFASPVATIAEVRHKLVDLQQKMGTKKCISMDGRDIGTVVFPNAEIKIFLTASAKIRAQRRFIELQNKGQKVNFNNILENVNSRDKIDSNRTESPLKKAKDAILIDNTNLNAQETFSMTLAIIAERYGNGIKLI